MAFEPLHIGWKGATYTVAPERCMDLLVGLEGILAPPGSGINILHVLQKPEAYPLTSLASAYAFALRYAGAEVSVAEVYLSISDAVRISGDDGYEQIMALAAGLMSMFFPGWAQSEPLAQGDKQGK